MAVDRQDARSAAQDRSTTSAIGPHGRSIFFDDLVRDGEHVEVEGRPMIVYYDPDAPDWFVRNQRPSHDELREALMRCGALAISERVDGCVPRSRALRIREITYRACWPEEDEGLRVPSGPSASDRSAASLFEYPTLREQLEAALHNIDCLHVDEDENALDYYRAERAKGLLREAIGGLTT